MAARLTALIVVAIVSITVIAGLIVGAQRDDNNGPVDLIVYNARVFPADGTAPYDGAVAVRGNTILRAGPSREVRRLRRAQTVEVDARGGTVLPGFNDAHVHFVCGGLGMERVNLLDATTLEADRGGHHGVCSRQSGQALGDRPRLVLPDRFPAGCRRARCSTSWCRTARPT